MALCKAPYWKMPWRSRLRSCWWPKWCEGWAILSILKPPPSSSKHEDIFWCPFECANWVYVKLQIWGPPGGSLGTGTCPNPIEAGDEKVQSLKVLRCPWFCVFFSHWLPPCSSFMVTTSLFLGEIFTPFGGHWHPIVKSSILWNYRSENHPEVGELSQLFNVFSVGQILVDTQMWFFTSNGCNPPVLRTHKFGKKPRFLYRLSRSRFGKGGSTCHKTTSFFFGTR